MTALAYREGKPPLLFTNGPRMAAPRRRKSSPSHRSLSDTQTCGTGIEEEPDWDRSHVIICSPAGAGCSGRLKLRLTWDSREQQHPDIGMELLLDPLQVPCYTTVLSPRMILPVGVLWQRTHLVSI